MGTHNQVACYEELRPQFEQVNRGLGREGKQETRAKKNQKHSHREAGPHPPTHIPLHHYVDREVCICESYPLSSRGSCIHVHPQLYVRFLINLQIQSYTCTCHRPFSPRYATACLSTTTNTPTPDLKSRRILLNETSR